MACGGCRGGTPATSAQTPSPAVATMFGERPRETARQPRGRGMDRFRIQCVYRGSKADPEKCGCNPSSLVYDCSVKSLCVITPHPDLSHIQNCQSCDSYRRKTIEEVIKPT